VSERDPVAFLVRLGRALHAAGSPAHRLEDALGHVARATGLEAQFFSTPTSIFAAFGPATNQRMVLARVVPGDSDLERLADLDELLEDVVRGAVDEAEANRRLTVIEERPPRYRPWVTILAHGLVSAAAARFFGGSWTDIAVACGVGLVIGLLAAVVATRPGGGRVFELLAALLASTLATMLAAVGVAIAPFLVTLAGLIVLVPGLTLTVAMNELATRHLVAGSSRLAGAISTFILLAFGAAFGTQLGALFGPVALITPEVAPAWTEPIALLLSATGLTILLRARQRDFPWVLAAATLALVAGRAATALLGTELGAFGGALVVGLAGNLFARFLRRPAAILHVPGLLLLVPGSVGFRSLTALLERETLAGVQTAFSMVLVSIGLVAGLLVAGALVPPRRAL
jgi:uncharacterized membrane protein YjjP (DUF1212 family)